jgi:hypothetical protein
MAARVPLGGVRFFSLTIAQLHWLAVDSQAVIVVGREKRNCSALLRVRAEPSG